jgi:hypothetical protein
MAELKQTEAKLDSELGIEKSTQAKVTEVEEDNISHDMRICKLVYVDCRLLKWLTT